MKFINIQVDRFNKSERLSEEDKAQLLDSIIKYARDGVEPDDDKVSPIVSILFNPVKSDMDYYDGKYQARCEANKRNGATGGRPKKNNPNETNGLFLEPKEKREKIKDKEEKIKENTISCSTQSVKRVSARTPLDEESQDRFNTWWKYYDKKVGRVKAVEAWSNLSKEDQIKCLSVVQDYVHENDEKRYRKDPVSYLVGQCWNDEIIKRI